MTTIRELQERAYRQSADKGFHDDRPIFAGPALQNWQSAKIALMHSELSEALEELRRDHPVDYTYYNVSSPTKPEGVPSEMADVVIRVLDFCGANGIDLEGILLEKLSYNSTRTHKHGKAF